MRNLKAILMEEGLIRPSRKASPDLDFGTFRDVCAKLMASYGPSYAPLAKLIANRGADDLVGRTHISISKMLRQDRWSGDLSDIGEFSDLLNDLMGEIVSDNTGDWRRPMDAVDRSPLDMRDSVAKPDWKITPKLLSRVLSRM